MSRASTLDRGRLSSATPAAPPTRGERTVARILEGALELLNRSDGAAVTTNHIAAHLRMSPGNLYYHFRNREEIVRAIFPRIVSEALAATALPAGSQLTAHEFGERHLQGLRTLWRYRFFFRDLHQFIVKDAQLAEDYRDYQRRLRVQYRSIFERLIADGSMQLPEPAEDLDRLVADSMVIWANWIPHLMALRPRREITRRDVVEGALHSFLVVAPFLARRFAAETRRVIESYGARST
jgi:AcrR family transcriptional regulator